MKEHSTLEGTSILVVDDHRNIRVTLRMILEGEGAEMHEASTFVEAQQMLDRGPDQFDLILLDIRLSDGSGLELLRKISRERQASRVVMISGEGTVGEAIEATNLGAFDYMEKPFTPERLLVTAKRCLDYHRLKRQALAQEEILGDHPSIVQLNALVRKIAKTQSRVLITGETGTGKELVARGLHRQSVRNKHPMIKVNCAAIPHSLMESELFGHEKGAFTGASKLRRGLFEQAHQGTLFLDEIAELSLEVQAKLLRVLETGEFTRIGSENPVKTDVRVLAATHRNLSDTVKEGLFREDLYYRLNVVTISIPPLRDRGDDVELLAKYFLELTIQEHSLARMLFAEKAIEQLHRYPWPGNIRELKNIVERSAILAAEGTIDELSGLDTTPVVRMNVTGDFQFGCDTCSWQHFQDLAGKAYVTFVLQNTGGNVSEAARILEVERAYLHRLMRKLEVQRDVVVG